MNDRDFESDALRLAAIVEYSDDAIVSKDLDGTIRSWNRAAERMFGRTADEVVGRSIRIIIPDDRQSEEDEVLSRIRRGEIVDHFETIRRRKDGTLVPVSITVSPVRNAAGTIIGVSKIARDLSERRRNEAALAEARSAQTDLQRRLMTLVAASGSLLVSPRLEDVVPAALNLANQLLNPEASAVWRLHPADQAWRMESHQGLSDAFAQQMIATLRSAPSELVSFSDPHAAEDVMATPMLNLRREAYDEEGIKSMMVVPLRIGGHRSGTLVFYYKTPHRFSDVETETARALGNLVSAAFTTAELYDAQRRSRGQFEFLAEAASVLAGSLDYQSTLTRVADLAVPHIADWCAVDLLNDEGDVERLAVAHVDPVKSDMARRFQERFPQDPSSPYSVTHVIRSGAPVLVSEITEEMIRDGARSPTHLAAIRELDIRSYMSVPLIANGRTLGALTFVAGTSGRRYTDADLRFAQSVASRAAVAVDNARVYEEVRRANRLKDDFLATLSHELRTPLNAILGYARMLKSGIVTGDRLVRAFEILYNNATSLTQIVEDVLDVSRIVSGKIHLKMQRVDLPPLLVVSVETVQPTADAKGVRLRTTVDPGVVQVAGDPDRLQQVLWNLLSNAVKFTPPGGQVDVRLERTDSHAEITVSDTGIGIAPDFLPYIFERFRQGDSRFAREFGGLGLGLAIGRHLVEMHGGTIVAASEGVGKGTTFRVTLPAMAAPVGALREPRSVGPVAVDGGATRLSALHVLVVDDEADALTMVRELLESAGARVTTAASGEAALDVLLHDAPDLILSDIGMSDMDGFELIKRVRALPSAVQNIPAGALTAYARPEDRTRALGSGFQAHLAKPIDPDALLSAVEVLAGREPIAKR
jgi:PAS domain S-box-containing protein